jgi:aminoglycoside phosphotransferase (APT) family kinase protein
MPNVSAGADSTAAPARFTDFIAALRRMGLIDAEETPAIHALAGGVSSDIVRADLKSGPVCIKRALPKLKVKADWQAPVERNRWEVQWMRTAGAIVPEAVPAVLGEDRPAGMFAMAYLDERDYPVWKARLRDGAIDPGFAAEVGRRVARIHAATAGDATVAAGFSTDHVFHSIRLEPYLIATARLHPELAFRLEELARITAATRQALVHGDISPKNILCGPRSPVFLDAECAWYGDPVFDLAFCLNHLLLKCLWRPHWSERYLACFDALEEAYLAGVTWEPRERTEARAAALLPGLFLARVDGKSPAEYITQDRQRDAVRRVASALLLEPVATLAEIRARWAEQARAFPRE